MRFSQIVVEDSRVQLCDFMSTVKLQQMIVAPSTVWQLCSSIDGDISPRLDSPWKKPLELTKREIEENG